MFNSSKSSKIRFNRIRQSKLDYIKHLIANKLGLVATASLTFLFGALFTLNITAIYAQPASTPPNGNVNASFNSLNILGIGANGNSITTGIAPASFGGDIIVGGEIKNTNNNADFTINDNVNIIGSIKNSLSTVNGGAVQINDPQGLDVRGPIQNTAANATNTGTLPVSITDDVEITRNLTVSGSIKTAPGASIGTFFTASRSLISTSSSSITVTCPANSVVVGCTGSSTNLTDGISDTTPLMTRVSSSGNACTFTPMKTPNRGGTAQARCFDPTGTQGDITVTN